ncbi:hypothetical protein BY996DRAFT_6567913 [Phakopsora pachyrhizi]|uniref:Uncharacterized protein n=1 Tax=Phakopsora pachyrhizi TaxID=170000 RepID=A0AAV0AIS8_PHAPC|nr:hypothetical protein BY996DRAFT_6567913 [Phakopsora pachyrhizi]CAH7667633.1 hypothetical protein PPACK8108_LOCUS2052 [Phakopsora pachyrhizi]
MIKKRREIYFTIAVLSLGILGLDGDFFWRLNLRKIREAAVGDEQNIKGGSRSLKEPRLQKNLESNQTLDTSMAMELDHVGDQYPEDLPNLLADGISSGELKGQEVLLSGALVKVVLSNAVKIVSAIRNFLGNVTTCLFSRLTS